MYGTVVSLIRADGDHKQQEMSEHIQMIQGHGKQQDMPEEFQMIQRHGKLQEMVVQMLLSQVAGAVQESGQGSISDYLAAEIWFEMAVHHVVNEMESVAQSNVSNVIRKLLRDRADIGPLKHAGIPGDTDEASQQVVAAVVRRIFDNAVAMKKPGLAFTELQLAAELGYKLVAILLLEEGVDGAFYQACESGCSVTVQLLLQNGADIHMRLRVRGGDDDWLEWTALHLAWTLGHMALVRLLLREGADPNEPGRIIEDNGAVDDMLPLTMAASAGHLELVRLLLENGADPNRRTDKYTPLHASVLTGNYAICQMLLDSGADMNAKVPSSPDMTVAEAAGGTALHLAVLQKNYPILQLLLDRRVDIRAITESGETALQLANTMGDETAMKLLRRASSRNPISRLYDRLSRPAKAKHRDPASNSPPLASQPPVTLLPPP